MTTTEFNQTHPADVYATTDRRYAATARNDIAARRPLFEPIDLVAAVAATIMALGPLTAYTVGF